GYKPSAIRTVEIGAKPGEKLYEELMSDEEVSRSMELKDMFVITPAFKSIYQSIDYSYPDVVSMGLTKSYVSATEKPMGKDDIRDYLLKNGLLDDIWGGQTGRTESFLTEGAA
nr:polysaccharide biosynthesis protein [Nitrospiraceae bacterium]